MRTIEQFLHQTRNTTSGIQIQEERWDPKEAWNKADFPLVLKILHL